MWSVASTSAVLNFVFSEVGFVLLYAITAVMAAFAGLVGLRFGIQKAQQHVTGPSFAGQGADVDKERVNWDRLQEFKDWDEGSSGTESTIPIHTKVSVLVLRGSYPQPPLALCARGRILSIRR